MYLRPTLSARTNSLSPCETRFRTVFADLESRREGAKPAFPFLDIGLDDIAAVAHPFVPRVALLQLLGDGRLGVAGDDFLPEAVLHFVEQGLVTPEITRLQDGAAHGMIVGGDTDQKIGRAHV